MKKLICIPLLLFALEGVTQNNIDNILSNVAKNNKTLLAAAQLSNAKRLEYKTGLTPDDPRVDFDYLVGSPAGAGNQTDFSVTQAFDFPTAYSAKKKVSNQQIEKSEIELNALRQDILLETKMSCFHLVYLNQRKNELNKRVRNATELFQGYKTKMQNGEATILDVNKAQLLLLNIKTDLALNESEIKQTVSKLTELNGGLKIQLTDSIYPAAAVVPGFATIDSLIEANDLRVKLVNKDKNISEARVKFLKGMALPKIEAGYHSQAILGQRYQGAHVGFSIPLWQNKNTVKTEKAFLLFNDYRITEHRNEHFYENQQLYEKYLVLKSTLEEYNEIFRTSDNATLLDKSRKGGNISSIEYFMELSYFYSAFDSSLKTEKEYQQTIAQLFRFQL
jgi:outer membrane protein, heavy metal efflux system